MTIPFHAGRTRGREWEGSGGGVRGEREGEERIVIERNGYAKVL